MMTDMSTAWKLFRVVCVLQLLAIVAQLVISAIGLMTPQTFFYSFTGIVIYTVIFLFVLQALSMINQNYPDTPLSPRQKKKFNWLFILNFAAIAFLFGVVVGEWKTTLPLLAAIKARVGTVLLIGFPLILSIMAFLFHLILLFGMYRLRRTIYHNTIERWQQQFGDSASPTSSKFH
ncbi:MAG: hypothetical protein H7Y31_07240 [Chitinophagaceae bacterium]|nr:hypothetical protein [Chitinophagaceae bacterium]